MQFFLTFLLLLTAIEETNSDFLEGVLNTLNELIDVAKSDTLDGVHPETFMTTLEIFQYYGYPGEKHHVITRDDYILEIHRIPFGKYNSTRSRRPPVFLQHSMSAASSMWVLNKEESLAFLLADGGYDVWLGNLRGNSYGKRHVKLSPKDPRFWNFNVDDHAHSDLPAMIDYVLQITGFDKLTFAGLSLGATAGTLLLAGSPQYNDKVKLAALMAPVLYTRYFKNPLRLIGDHVIQFNEWFSALGTKEIRVRTPLSDKLAASTFTDYPGAIICDSLLSIFGGYNERLHDSERAHVFSHHTAHGTSFEIFQHFAMTHHAGKPIFFDYGPDGNRRKYGQVLPPFYNFSKITPPTAIFYGYMDLFTDRRDLERLASEITGPMLLEMVPYDSWMHTDFVFAKDAKKHFYDRLISLINSYH